MGMNINMYMYKSEVNPQDFIYHLEYSLLCRPHRDQGDQLNLYVADLRQRKAGLGVI
jgi:hypothetical protein